MEFPLPVRISVFGRDFMRYRKVKVGGLSNYVPVGRPQRTVHSVAEIFDLFDS